MGNCLKTQLKAEVTNENLRPFNAIRFVKNGGNVKLQNTEAMTINAKDGGYFALTQAGLVSDQKTTWPVDANTFITIYLPSEDTTIEVTDKYGITIFEAGNAQINFNDLEYCQSLSSFSNDAAVITGDISLLSKITSITSFSCNNSNISGDIAALGGNTGLQSLYVSRSAGLIGDINSLNSTVLATMNISKTNIGGNISSLSKFTGLTALYGAGSSLTGNVSSLSTIPSSLKRIELDGCNISGNVDGITNTTLEILKLNATKCSGDIATFAGMTGLKELQVGGCSGMSGNIEDLCEAMKSHRAEGDTLSVQANVTSIKYQNANHMYFDITFTGGSYTVTTRG